VKIGQMCCRISFVGPVCRAGSRNERSTRAAYAATPVVTLAMQKSDGQRMSATAHPLRVLSWRSVSCWSGGGDPKSRLPRQHFAGGWYISFVAAAWVWPVV